MFFSVKNYIGSTAHYPFRNTDDIYDVNSYQYCKRTEKWLLMQYMFWSVVTEKLLRNNDAYEIIDFHQESHHELL
jgi:hypothetical protein